MTLLHVAVISIPRTSHSVFRRSQQHQPCYAHTSYTNAPITFPHQPSAEACRMEAVRPSSHAGSQERNANPNPHLIPRPRTATSERGHRSGAPRVSEENRSPSNLPRSFQGMLKTTTETGDIGMFSIKPSRIPQALNSPRSNSMSYVEGVQKPRHNFQPYGVPIVDDRRRLPSYSKDTTSEAIALYQSSSPRPGHQVAQNSDHRSYSMTQASSYALSNHRSFASLRSQQEGAALLQRPRPPFAYPTRLRRPGVRPSSPALTDGGLVDYSRRAEIERIHPVCLFSQSD